MKSSSATAILPPLDLEPVTLEPLEEPTNGSAKSVPAISIKEPEPVPGDEDTITQAVQILSNLATLKLKAQELRDNALQVRTQVDVLFSDETVSEEAMNRLKEGFKVLKAYAQVNLRFREARSQAEQARAVLDQALRS